MVQKRKIKLVRAYDSTQNTGVLEINHAHTIVEKVRSMAQTDGMVAISMKGITSMSPITAAELCQEIKRDKKLTNKVAIVGSTPYINQIIGMGMRKASKASFTSGRTIKAVSTLHK